MNYKKKRVKAGLSTYTMAKHMGISEEKYKEVEKKIRPLEGDLLDKFQETIANANQIKLDSKIKKVNIDLWFRNGQVKEVIKEYGYSQYDLSKELNIPQSTISKTLNNKKTTDNIREKIYDFLTNPINKKIKTDLKDKKHDEEKIGTKHDDIKERIKALHTTQLEIARLVGCHASSISCLITGKRFVDKKMEDKVYKVLDELEASKPRVIEESYQLASKPENKNVELDGKHIAKDSEEKAMEVPKNEIVAENSEATIDRLNQRVRQLERQIYLYEKLIDRL